MEYNITYQERVPAVPTTVLQRLIEETVTKGLGFGPVRMDIAGTLKEGGYLGNNEGVPEGAVGGCGIGHNTPLGLQAKLRAMDVKIGKEERIYL
ncbi:MAG: hypothetical protein V2A62_04930 [Candidatus Woesearchaeota archaeon]